MAHSFEFSVLQATPDSLRGERINVGVVAATPNGIVCRFPELRKLKMLTGHAWEGIADAYQSRLCQIWTSTQSLAGIREQVEGESEIFSLAEAGSMVGDPASFEHTMEKILDTYVTKPALTRAQRQQRINTEIARHFRTVGVMQDAGETIDDHKVVQRYVISPEKDIVADFAFKNGKMKIVSTLDLRGVASAHSKACEKGATLYFAKEKYGPKTCPFGVYAVRPADAADRKSEIEILNSFADGNTFNWMDAHDRQRFAHKFY